MVNGRGPHSEEDLSRLMMVIVMWRIALGFMKHVPQFLACTNFFLLVAAWLWCSFDFSGMAFCLCICKPPFWHKVFV